MLAGVPPEVRGRVVRALQRGRVPRGRGRRTRRRRAGTPARGDPPRCRPISAGWPSWRSAALLCALLARRLSRDVEAPAPATADLSNRGLQRSRGAVQQLAALFAVDAFAGGFIVQLVRGVLVRRASSAPRSRSSASASSASGCSRRRRRSAAGWLGDRIGLVNTMVFTHLPSNVLLALIPFAPTLPIAFGLLLARSVLSQMDVPARQAFVVALVDPSERTAAAAVHERRAAPRPSRGADPRRGAHAGPVGRRAVRPGGRDQGRCTTSRCT